MNKTREKIASGVRMFENEITSLEFSPYPSQNNREPLPASLLMEDRHSLLSIKDTYTTNERSLPAFVTKDEICLPARQLRPPPGFHNSVNDYLPLNANFYSSTVSLHQTRVPTMDSYNSSFPEVVSANNYRDPSSLRDNFFTPIFHSNSSIYPSNFLTHQSYPQSHPESYSHQEFLRSSYSLSITDLCRQTSGSPPISTPTTYSNQNAISYPLNSEDTDFQSADDNDSSETSSIDDQSYYSMPAYHVANASELSSDEKQDLDEAPVPKKDPEPKRVPDTLISNRLNRRNVSRIQGVNTCISSGGKRQTPLRMNRGYLPQSVAKYTSSEDSGADVSMDEDSPPDCKGCEALSKKVSLADSQQQWKRLPEYGLTNFLSLRCKPGFIDSHCHLDFLLDRQNYKGTYSDYMQQHRGTYPASYEGCVAVFCHPYTFHKRNMWQKYLGEKGVWGAFGCHPHHSKFYDDAVEHHLKQAIQHLKVRALGEIGLDYSNRNNCSKVTQQQVFRQQLKIALNEKLPLVIHCRDANEDTMRIMKETLPKNYIIHLHCFTDGWDWAQKWLKEFPNLCIGITNLVTFLSATPTHDVVKRIPLDRLLLETDAPYFVPKKYSQNRNLRHSHPGMAIHVAAQIAALRNVSLTEIIHHTRQNTRKIYGI